MGFFTGIVWVIHIIMSGLKFCCKKKKLKWAELCICQQSKNDVWQHFDIMTSVKLEGKFTTLAQVEGLPDVFTSSNFTLLKSRYTTYIVYEITFTFSFTFFTNDELTSRWVSDDEVSVCQCCQNKFNQLRRKHHCRQCGNVYCSKCCNEKVRIKMLHVTKNCYSVVNAISYISNLVT